MAAANALLRLRTKDKSLSVSIALAVVAFVTRSTVQQPCRCKCRLKYVFHLVVAVCGSIDVCQIVVAYIRQIHSRAHQ